MSDAVHPAPSLRYYRANEGRWRAAFVFAITDRAGLAESRVGWLDRLRVGLMVLVPKLLGPFLFETSVDATSHIADGEVMHTTRISKWGLTLYAGTEAFALHPNGRDIAISRRDRMWPSLFWRKEGGRGEVEPSGLRAHYVFSFFGVELRQTGSIEEGGVRIVQETLFSRVELLLVRS